MTEDELVDDVFDREGRVYGDEHTSPPIDQPTAAGGITLPAYSEFLGRPATIAELKALTPTTAAPVVKWKLRQISRRNGLDLITFEPLRLQMIDFAYNSGDGLAMRWLQRVLRVPRTSKMDVATATALAAADGFLTNQALVAARLQMIDLSTDSGTVDKRFEEGLENRALKFSLLTVP